MLINPNVSHELTHHRWVGEISIFSVNRVAFLAVARGIVAVAAQEPGSSVEKSHAFAGETFSTRSWIAAGLANSSDRLATDKPSKDAYSLTGPNGEHPSDVLAGGLDDET